MPSTKKVHIVDAILSLTQTVLKRGKAVQDKQTKNDIDSSLMSFFKIVISEDSELYNKLVVGFNDVIEEFASSLSNEYNIEIFDKLSGDGFFTEVVEGMKKYCAESLSKVQSDARRQVLIDSGSVPAELWEADTVKTSSAGISADLAELADMLKKD